jgi:hypothetical protein
MKKRKIKLREKIKNKPKSRNHPKEKKSIAQQSFADKLNRPAVETADDGMEVMSHVILDFAEPLLETCYDEASQKKAISLAIYVWNATLLPEQEQKQTLQGYLSECQKVMSPEELQSLTAHVEQLVQSKKARFAGNKKKITNCTFGDFKNSRHIEVGYTME